MKTTSRSVKGTQAAPRKPVDPKPTRKELLRYLELNQYRKDLEKQAREIKKEENPIAEKITTWLDKQRVRVGETTRLHGFDLGFENAGRYPAWKQLFIQFEGQEAADEVIANTEESLALVISKA